MNKKKASVGSTFESYLEDQGTLTETTIRAVKRVIAFQLKQAMEEQGISKTILAEQMHTSRSQLDRVLDPDNEGVTLQALASAAEALGHELSMSCDSWFAHRSHKPSTRLLTFKCSYSCRLAPSPRRKPIPPTTKIIDHPGSPESHRPGPLRPIEDFEPQGQLSVPDDDVGFASEPREDKPATNFV